jgi:hypothetical protein
MRTTAALACAALSACAPPSGRAPSADAVASTQTYTNPVLDIDFPDPTVIRASDGTYYAYATQGERDGTSINIQVARSRDLVAWERIGDALPVKPSWASRTQDFWAPHVSEHGGTFYLYYSAKPDAALGVRPGAQRLRKVAGRHRGLDHLPRQGRHGAQLEPGDPRAALHLERGRITQLRPAGGVGRAPARPLGRALRALTVDKRNAARRRR